jgi:hypothetical protein
MQEDLSTTISFRRIIGTEGDRGYAPVYTPVFWQSEQPATPQPAISAFDAHQASPITPQEARTLALLTTPHQQATHSFESLLTALTQGSAAAGELPEARLPSDRPSPARRRRLRFPATTDREHESGLHARVALMS